MKKITYLVLTIALIIFTNGCSGYKPIFSSTNLQFKIANYSIKGDKVIGRKIYSKLHGVSKSTKDDQNITNINLLIDVSKDKNVTSKDSAGKITGYKITLNTKIIATDFETNKKILNQNFNSSLTYKVQNQYSTTMKLENKSIENLINKTYQELLIKLSHKISAK